MTMEISKSTRTAPQNGHHPLEKGFIVNNFPIFRVQLRCKCFLELVYLQPALWFVIAKVICHSHSQNRWA